MIAFNESKFIIGKEEYAPYAAELHYFRIPKRYWSICFERIRKAGFRIISSIVPWNLHEDNNRDFDFSGFSDPSKDLIVFVELVREFGFKLILKPGPWLFSEYTLNGLPKFLEKYPEIFARDKDGEILVSENRAGVKGSYYPSIGSPRFMNFVRHYFNGLTEIIKNYVYPRGPLFLLELDSEDYFGGHPEPHLSDYNEVVVNELYPQWLEEKYGDVKEVAKVYGNKAKSFEEFEPPREFENVNPKDMARVMDWFRFKEHLLDNFQCELREMYKTFSCEPMFIRTLPFSETLQEPLTSSRVPSEGCLSGAALSWDVGTGANLARVRHLRTVAEFPFLTQLPVGNWSYNPERSREYYPIKSDATRYMITAGLAGGAKGLIYHMFAGRDHWYGAALADNGTIQDSYELIKSFNINAQENNISEYSPVCSLGVAVYRPHIWESMLKQDDERKGLARHLLRYTMPKFRRDLDMLKYDFGMPDLSIPASLEPYKTLVIPVSDIMSKNEQEYIIELAKSGKNIVLIGLLPQYDTSMQKCNILEKALKVKTTRESKLGHIVADGQEFTAMVFGSLTTTERRSRKLARVSKKAVAISFSKYRGTVVLLSFDPSTDANHHKMTFLEQILESCKLKRYVETSNPRIRAVIHEKDKSFLLYLLNSMPQLKFKEIRPAPTRTAVQVDLKTLGYKGAKVKMTDLFSGEVINTTVSELASGIYLSMSELDGRIYRISNK